MPTAASTTYSADILIPFQDPEQARQENVNIVASATLAKGTVLGELTATPGSFKAYASGSSDGSQIPKCILDRAVITDASGNITFTTTSGQVGNQIGATEKVASAYYSGTFLTTDLVGLDANAITVMGGRFISGVLSNGVVRFG